jgi:hypothetical protein
MALVFDMGAKRVRRGGGNRAGSNSVIELLLAIHCIPPAKYRKCNEGVL